MHYSWVTPWCQQSCDFLSQPAQKSHSFNRLENGLRILDDIKIMVARLFTCRDVSGAPLIPNKVSRVFLARTEAGGGSIELEWGSLKFLYISPSSGPRDKNGLFLEDKTSFLFWSVVGVHNPLSV